MLKKLREIVKRVERDREALAVILFGSYARGEGFTDIDVCVALKPMRFDALHLSKKRLMYLSAFPNIDIQIFQQLPLAIRVRILREGKVEFCKDQDLLYDLALSTMRDFADFKPIYLSYLEGVLHAR